MTSYNVSVYNSAFAILARPSRANGFTLLVSMGHEVLEECMFSFHI